MNNFERAYQEFWPQIAEQILLSDRTVIFEQNYHWMLVELSFSRDLYAFDF